ncbi:hypothetical protein [Rudanella lutea]|uniref:hypothetical protein n=1 Tax=Rudanella lutea TaxID=451374 RepID=UPI00035E3602|nr:hypothetical protein [Rudanella lutea]
MTTSNPNQNPFDSFWWAGFECTDQLNCFGNRVDFLDITGHLVLCDDDYERIRAFGLHTVREGIGWSKVEKRPYQYDWSEVQYLMERGRVHGIQQVWDICHFGYADDLHPLHPMFARRFAALCRAFVQMYRDNRPDGPLVVTPINEVSFISWLGGDARGTQPYTTNQGFAVKYGLMRAYIEGIAAMREIDPTVRILTTEPLVNMVPPLHPDLDQIRQAAEAHTNQYQAVDMLAGRMCPELGGTEDNLDILGFNYYYNNQWVVPTFDFLPWVNEGNDPRWRPLRSLLIEAYGRYKRPVALTETSHPGIDRPGWIRFVGEECRAAIEQGVPLWGVCLYPIIDRPDWDHLDREWHHSGLWDADLSRTDQPPARVLYQPYADALRDVQQRVGRNLFAEING